MSRSTAIFAYAAGYSVTWLFATAIGYLVLMPFGYGYIGAELVFAYMAWATIYRWELVQLHLASYLDAYGL